MDGPRARAKHDAEEAPDRLIPAKERATRTKGRVAERPETKLSNILESFPTDRLTWKNFREVEGIGKGKVVRMCPVGLMADALGFNWRIYDRWWRAECELKAYQGGDESIRLELVRKAGRLLRYKGAEVGCITGHVEERTPLDRRDINHIVKIAGPEKPPDEW